MSFNQMFDFIKTRVLPSKKFLADSKRFNRLYEKLFKRKDSKKRQIFEMPEDSKDREVFSPQDIEQVLKMEVEQGELAEINQPVPSITAQQENYKRKISDLEAELRKTRFLLKETQEEIVTLHKSHAGEKSGLKRRLSKLDPDINDQCSKDNQFVNGEPYIHITKRLNDDIDSEDNNIFIGMEYLGERSGKKLMSTGKENIYVRISSPGVRRKLNSEMTSKGVDKRVTLALHFLSLLSGNSWNSVATGDIDGNELVHLSSRMFKKQVGIFSRLLETGKSSVTKMLTVCQLVDLKVLLNLPMLSIRRMRTMFCNFGFDIFPSEQQNA